MTLKVSLRSGLGNGINNKNFAYLSLGRFENIALFIYSRATMERTSPVSGCHTPHSRRGRHPESRAGEADFNWQLGQCWTRHWPC